MAAQLSRTNYLLEFSFVFSRFLRAFGTRVSLKPANKQKAIIGYNLMDAAFKNPKIKLLFIKVKQILHQ